MKVENFRISNLVNVLGEDRKIIGVSARLRPDCGYFEFDGLPPIKGMHLKPIPLTEKWLTDFGFEKTGSAFYRVSSDLDFSFKISFTGTSWRSSNAVAKNGITDVHQLQNLYYAIAGEELTLSK